MSTTLRRDGPLRRALWLRRPTEGEKRFSGDVIRPSDPRYGAARTLWNAMTDNHPALIVRPRTVADVSTAILVARDGGLEIAVRCDGHSLPGHSMVEGGLTLDSRR